MTLELFPRALLCMLLLTAISCKREADFDRKVVLEGELLSHFKDDSLKQKAAIFLLRNMDGKYSKDGPLRRTYSNTINLFRQGKPDSLELALKRLKNKEDLDSLYPDLEFIEADYLIKNIERAFAAYSGCGWGDKISFNDFCEYILPYRVNHEPLEEWWSAITTDRPIQTTNIIEAAALLADRLSAVKKEFVIRWGDNSLKLPDLPYSSLTKLPIGTCLELSTFAALSFRAYGLPCAVDFTPNYGNFPSGHQWNSLILSSNQCVPFAIPLSKNQKLGYFKLPSNVLGKVYRHTFTIHSESFSDFLGNPYIIDVTDQYIKTSNVQVEVQQAQEVKGIPLLSVIRKMDWVPIASGRISGKSARFEKIGRGVVFLPIIERKDQQYPLNYPFFVDDEEDLNFFIPDYENLTTLRLKRKYPLKPRIIAFINRTVGGEFQASNHEDFRKFTVLHRIDKFPGENFKEVPITDMRKFRYLRYVGPDSSFCNIAEIEFYSSSGSSRSLNGTVIGSKEVEVKHSRETAFDNDPLTFFNTKHHTGWVGLKLSEASLIRKIRFIPRTDYNIIVPGNVYELLYWDNGWRSAGKQTAVKEILLFEHIPSKAIYQLLNHTAGRQIRIFSYDNNEQVWW